MPYKHVKNIGRNHSSRTSYGYGSGIDGITVHWWGGKGQKHQNVVDWLRGYTGNRGSSAHYVASDGLVTQIVEDSRASWHGGNNKANGTTIGIEMRPEMTDGDWATLVELCVNLERKHGSLKYYGHKDWKSTACPGKYYDRLGELVDAVNAYKKSGKVPSTTGGGSSSSGGSSKKYTVVSKTADLGLYDKDGEGRTRVEDWQADALGYSDKAADGYFGSDTEGDTKALQRQLGVTADGLVGDDTLAAWKKAGSPKLGKATKPKPSKSSGNVPGPGYDFPWPKGHYIGPKDGPDRSHSGFYKNRKWSGKYDESWLKALPEQLIRRGWSIGKGKTYLSKFGNDGHYGSEYAALIRAFQNAQGLAVDELGGREVWDEAFKRPVT